MINLQLTIEQVNAILGHLGRLPYEQVHALIQEIIKQGEPQAKAIESAGAFAIVLEMVPSDLAAIMTKELSIPTVGIGAGNATDAQVLVWTDAFGLTKNPPKLAKAYRNLRAELLSGAKEFANEVAAGQFPSESETFK